MTDRELRLQLLNKSRGKKVEAPKEVDATIVNIATEEKVIVKEVEPEEKPKSTKKKKKIVEAVDESMNEDQLFEEDKEEEK